MLSMYSRRTTDIPLVAMLALLLVSLLSACGSAPPQRPVAETTGERLLREARAAHAADRYQQALLRYTDATEHYRSLDDNRQLALALVSRAEILLLFGESEGAMRTLGELGDALQRFDNTPGLEARRLLLEARLKASMSDGSEAARKAVATLLDREDAIGEAARILDCREQLRLGDGSCVSTLQPASRLGKARVLRLRAEAQLNETNIEEALRFNQEALQLYREAHYRPGIASSLQERADILSQSGEAGDRSTARDLLVRALDIRIWLRDRVHAARVTDRLASMEPEGGWQALTTQLERERPRWLAIEGMLDILR
ncbi:MAG: hypothetical protein R3270_05685 [Gammaproteobacteria bacterium]|nr:hypothetical protein [Gammaproteobacteria bacterium]